MNANWVRFLGVLLVGALAGMGLTGCATVPVTGRSQLRMVSSDQEMQLGLNSFEQMKKEVPISRDPAANALVQKVGKRIAAVAQADLPEAQWEFVVFESKEANAFCLPGGKIGVYTGILPITQDEEGLATVIGHEVAHAAAHHGSERISQAMLLQAGEQVVGASVANFDPRLQAAAALAYGVGSQVGVVLPYSRRDESEADHIGLIYMARAGYNPEKAIEFWKRFAAATAGEGGPPSFLRTHPVTDVRIQQIQNEMPAALAEFRKSQTR
ncbi:MAG: M48 family metallopeptidase [Verrucomicrobiia bacterium]